MKIYMVTRNPFDAVANPYVASLMESIDAQFGDVNWGYGLDVFWKNEVFCYDIVHIQWPHMLVTKRSSEELVNRIVALKEHGVKIVATCHNLEPHYSSNDDEKKSYDIVYKMSDLVLHLGTYSLDFLRKKYPCVGHVLLQHQTLDTIYKHVPSKEEALRVLHLKRDNKYVLCFGLFRNDEERNLIISLADKLNPKRIKILAPSFYRLPNRRNPLLKVVPFLKYVACRFRFPGIKMYLKYVSDDMLPYFYAAADIALIQRVKILNSGNVPLACLMKKVVVGPNYGNVGLLLKEINNPSFEVNDELSIESAVDKALLDSANGKGLENYDYALAHFSTAIIAAKLHSYYKECLT